MPGSSWRFKEKERQNQMRAIIEDAVSKETKSLVAAGYYYLPIDQIRGKALVHLGIPSIFGGNINWAKIGPSFRLRIPRQRESPFLLPTYLGPRKFFKTRLPRRPERHFQDRAPQPRCVGGPEVLIVPRVETHESAGRTRARSTAARARRAAAAATADLPTETLKLTSSFLASSSADLRRGRGSPVVSRLPESKASERLAQLRSPEAKAAKARQDENTVPVQGRDGARAAAAAASSRALGEHGPHDEPLPAPVEGFDADAPVAVVAELPLADIDLNAAVVPTGGVSGSAARSSGRDGSVDFTVTFSKSAHIPAPASQADRALKRKSLSLAKRKAPVSVKGVAHSPRIAKQGAVEVAAPSPIASLGRAAPSLDLCSATTIVCSPSSRASGFKIPSPSSTLRQRLESPNMSLDAVELLEDARPPPSPIPTLPHTCDTAPSGSSEKTMSDRKASVFDIEVNRSEISIASVLNTSRMSWSSVSRDIIPVGHTPARYVANVPPPPVRVSSSSSEDGANRTSESIDAVFLRGAARRPPTPVPTPPQAYDTTSSGSSDKAMSDRKTAASESDSSDVIQSSQRSPLPLVAVFDKEKQLSLSPPSLSSTVASGGRKRREGSSGSSRGLTPLSGEQQRAVRKLFDESPPREVAEVAAAASGGDSVGEAIGDELSINTSRMSVGDLPMRSISDLSALSEEDEGRHHVSLRDAAERAALATESLRGSDAPSRVTVRTTSFAGSRTPSTRRGSSRSSVSRDNIPVGHTPARHVADVPPPPVRASSSSSEDGANRTSESIDAVFLRGAARRPPTPVPTPPQAYDTTSSGSSDKAMSDRKAAASGSDSSDVIQSSQRSPLVAVFDKEKQLSLSPPSLSSTVASGGRKRREGSSGSSRGLTPLSGEQQRAVRKLFDESPPREVAEVAAAASGGDSVGEAIGDELSINTSRMSVGDLSMRSISDLSALPEDDEGGHHVSLRDAAERAALATESLRGSDAPSRVTVRTTSFAGSRTPSTRRGSSRSSVSRDNIPVGHTPARHVADVPPPPVRASSSSEDGANRTSESIDAVFLRGAARRPPTPVPTPPQAYDTTSSGSSEKKASDSIPSKVAQRPQKSPPVAVFDKQQLQSPSPHNLSSAVPAAHDTTSTSSRPPGPSDAVSAASGTKRPLKSPPLIRPAPSSTTTTTKSSSKISVPSESSSSVPSSAAALAKVGASHSPPPSQSKPTPKRARMSISDAILLSGADPGRATAPAAESRPHASIRRSIAMMTPGPEETAPGPSATSPQGRRRSRESRASPPRGTAAVPTRQKTSVSVERIRILLPSHDQDSGHDRDLPAAQRSPSAAVEERGGQAPRQSSRMSPPSGGAPRRRRSTEKSTPSARRNTSSLSISDVDLGSEFDVDLEPANVSGGEEESPTPISALATSDRAPPRAHQQDGPIKRSWFETHRDQDSGHDIDLPAAQRNPSAAVEERGGQAPGLSSRMSPPSEERIAGGAPRRRRSTEKSTPSVRRNTSSFSIADLDLGSEFDVDLELANVSGGEEESPTPITALATSDRAPPRAHQQDGSVRRSWFETPRRAPDLFMNPKRIRMSAGADDTLSPAVRGRLGAGAEHSPPVSPSVSLPSSAPTTCRTSGTRDARDKDATLSSRTSSRVSIGVGVLYINSTRAQSSRPQQPDIPATGRARNDVSSSPQDLAGADPAQALSRHSSADFSHIYSPP